MPPVPARIADRIATGIKKFHPILASAKSRDVGESDTVTIVTDMLADIFGYDKYSEITSEHAIRGTYCDLATRIDGQLQLLLEVKAIGIELKDQHVKQAVDYAANQGVDWVVLTNGTVWRIYKITFSKPIDQELVIEINFSTLNPKAAKDVESLFLLCKEGWIKSVLGEFHNQKQALSRFFLGAVLLSDSILNVIRRELRRVSPDVQITVDEIRTALSSEVLKREVLEGEKAIEARKTIAKVANKALRAKAAAKEGKESNSSVAIGSLSDDAAIENGSPVSAEPEDSKAESE